MSERSRRAGAPPLFFLDPQAGLSLQAQLRRQLVAAIEAGVFPPGGRLPSSRALASNLGVSRNTVFLTYQQLIAEGHLAARTRSGVYVSDETRRYRAGHIPVAGRGAAAEPSTLAARMGARMPSGRAFRCPPDWQTHPYPFIEGRFDRSLFPVAEWREASRLALAVQEVEQWSVDSGETDDEMLIEEIRTKLLPRRGIQAGRDEILITVGEQQALHLAAELFLRRGLTAAMEEPGLPEIAELFQLRDARVMRQPVDNGGLVVDERLDDCDLVHVTPSRQRPTAVTMPVDRRRALLDRAREKDFIIIEDDFENEVTFLGKPAPALRAMEGGERVVYVASLSKVLAPGVRLGFMTAPPEVIAEARRLRDLMTRRPPPNNQRAAAHFLSLGHYDAMVMRLGREFEARLLALRDALNHYLPQSLAHALPQSVDMAPVTGGTTVWVRGPEGLNAETLAHAAAARGVLIEPASDYYAGGNVPQNVFRMGVTSIPAERIRKGVALLAETMRELTGDHAEIAGPETLEGESIIKALGGATLLYKTVYGEPCTIELHEGGAMTGRAGYASEDRDEGRWWVENDLWFRQWKHWAYGEPAGYRLQIEGERLFYLNEEGRRVDSAILAP